MLQKMVLTCGKSVYKSMPSASKFASLPLQDDTGSHYSGFKVISISNPLFEIYFLKNCRILKEDQNFLKLLRSL